MRERKREKKREREKEREKERGRKRERERERERGIEKDKEREISQDQAVALSARRAWLGRRAHSSAHIMCSRAYTLCCVSVFAQKPCLSSQNH